MGWTLKLDDKEKSFADWGLSKLHRRTPNFRHDVVTFVEDGVPFDRDALFNFDAEIEILKDGDRWFIGRLLDPQRSASGESESIVYQAKGVLSWMDDLVFRMAWKYLVDRTDPKSDKFTVFLADLILFQKLVGLTYQIATVKEQVQEIFTYLTSKWTDADPPIDAKLQLDDSKLPTHQAPFIEVSNVTCGMALEYTLKTCPDIAVWTDYSTDIPTVRIARRADLDAVLLEIKDAGEGDDSVVVKADIQPRNDLKVPAVVIEYRETNSINGQSIRFTSDDIWPVDSDPTAFKVLPQVVNLEGANLTYPTETLLVRTIDMGSIDWWKLHDSSLTKTFATSPIEVRKITIHGASRSGVLPYELLPNSGPWAPWMGGAAEEDPIEAYIDYEIYEMKNGAEVFREKKWNQLFQFRAMTTDKPSGTYTGFATGSPAEPVPIGMAKALYEATSETHYDGTIMIEEAECSGLVKVGNVVNIKNSKRPEWATMRAFVQSVEEDIDEGRTIITVGPPKFLGVNEIMDWLRGLRNSSTGLWATRTSGISANGALQTASRSHKHDLNIGKEMIERLVLMRPDNATQTPETLTAKIILDILAAHGKEIALREEQICRDGVTKYKIILASEDYDNPINPP